MTSFQLSTFLDKQNILALMQNVYPAYSYDNTFFDWQYLRNPNGEAKIFVAKDEEKIIGMYALIPNKFIYNDIPYFIWRVQDVMMNDEYRNQGLFFKLMTYSHSSIHWTKQDLFWAFPNENSYPSFKKYGFSDHSPYTLWEYTKKDINILPHNEYIIQEEKNFNSISDSFLNKFYKNKDYTNLYKDKNYLQWRYLAKEGTLYQIYSISDSNEIVGFFVLKKYINSSNDINLHICELMANNDTVLQDALLFCIEQKIKLNALMLNTFIIDPSMQMLLPTLGFEARNTGRKVVFHPGSSDKDFISSSLYFSLGDNDIF